MAKTDEHKQVATSVRLDQGVHDDLVKIADRAGIKVADLLRMGVRQFVDEVNRVGHIPLPVMPVMGGGSAS